MGEAKHDKTGGGRNKLKQNEKKTKVEEINRYQL